MPNSKQIWIIQKSILVPQQFEDGILFLKLSNLQTNIRLQTGNGWTQGTTNCDIRLKSRKGYKIIHLIIKISPFSFQVMFILHWTSSCSLSNYARSLPSAGQHHDPRNLSNWMYAALAYVKSVLLGLWWKLCSLLSLTKYRKKANNKSVCNNFADNVIPVVPCVISSHFEV